MKLVTLFSALLAVLGHAAQAQITYVPAPVTGYTADVIANGVGSVISSTTATVDRGNAAVQWCFADSSFVNPSGQRPIKALPRNGFFRSISTPGLTYQMGPSAGNNSLRIDGAASGTLTLTSPQPCSEVEILATEGNGNSDPKIFTVTFTDGTTQVFPNIVVPDWYGGTITPAIIVGSRVNRGNMPTDGIEDPGTNPRIYEVKLSLSVGNYGKLVQSVGVAKTSTDPVLNVMGISLGSDCVGMPTGGTATASLARVCPNLPVSLSLTGATIGGSITYQWQVSFDNGVTFTAIPGATTNPFIVRPTADAQYRATVTCRLQSATSAPVAVAVLPNVATLAYAPPPLPPVYCQTGTVTVAAATPTGGRFTSTAGLVIDPTTGLVNLATSAVGTYVVTYTVTLPCPATATATLTIAPAVAVRVGYPGLARFCQTGTAAVSVATPAGGTFASTPGLALNTRTGTVDLAASAPGSYVVTYSVATTCAAPSSTTIVVLPSGAATVSYGPAPATFCQAGTVAVTATPTGGTFASTAGLALDARTGTINLVASTPGTYTVSYTLGAACVTDAATTLTVAPPAATFAYACAPFYQNGPNPTPALTAAVAGSRFAAPAGLILDPATGTVDLGKSTVGTYDITYTTPGGCVSTTSFTVAKPLIFPNVITPNGDGLNDVLRLNLPTATGYTLQVFNRWGRRVYENTDPSQGWDAADNGPGMYYYRVQYTDCAGQQQDYKDWVEVLK